MIEVFPVAKPYKYRDNFGDYRRGPPPHSHQGIDIYAEKGTIVYAVADGVVKYADGGLGGTGINLYTDDAGERVYYAHLESRLVENGSRVRKFDPIGTVGDSGNAAGGPSHLHFEDHPQDGVAVNPYAALLAAEAAVPPAPTPSASSSSVAKTLAIFATVSAIAYAVASVSIPRIVFNRR